MIGRNFLWFLCGHLCCLAGFEWTRAWSFFAVDFRFATSLMLSVGLLIALATTLASAQERLVSGCYFVAWVAVVCFPLVVPVWLTQVGVVLLAGLLSLLSLKGRKRWLGMFCSPLLAALVLLCGPAVGASVILPVIYLEGKKNRLVIAQETALERARQAQQTSTPRAEIYWKGFARLYQTTAKGEGEKFSGKMLKDTLAMVESCHGVLISGSEHRGIYRFPTVEALHACHRLLKEYEGATLGVLSSVGAPKVNLVFRELGR